MIPIEDPRSREYAPERRKKNQTPNSIRVHVIIERSDTIQDDKTRSKLSERRKKNEELTNSDRNPSADSVRSIISVEKQSCCYFRVVNGVLRGENV